MLLERFKANEKRTCLALSSLAIAYFAIRAIYFASVMDPKVPPDEVAHMDRCLLFAEQGLSIENSEAAWATGLLPDEATLYYVLMGRIVALNFTPLSDLLLLRLVSVLLALVTVVYGWMWIRLITKNPWAQLLFLVMITNTLMFTAMAATVSYDAMVNLLAAMGIFYSSRFVIQKRHADFVATWLVLALGALTKVTFLPILGLICAAVAVHEIRGLKKWPNALRTSLRSIRWPGIVAVSIATLLTAGSIYLYGGNFLKYGRPVPKVEQVIPIESQLAYGVWARDYVLRDYLTGVTTYEQAKSLANSMTLQAVRIDTNAELDKKEAQRQRGLVFKPRSRMAYGLLWLQINAERTFGYLGHSTLLKKGLSLVPYLAILLFGLCIATEQWRVWLNSPTERIAIGIVLIYTLFIMQIPNYSAYLNFHETHMNVQGRYLFPVIVPFFGLLAKYLVDFIPKPAQLAVACAVITIFVYGDLPYFLLNADKSAFYTLTP